MVLGARVGDSSKMVGVVGRIAERVVKVAVMDDPAVLAARFAGGAVLSAATHALNVTEMAVGSGLKRVGAEMKKVGAEVGAEVRHLASAYNARPTMF
jgi:hypothetical protein